MPLTLDTPRAYETGDINDLSVAGGAQIFEGSAVGIVAASGLARPLAAGDLFVGFADRGVDNRTGAAGAVRVRLRETGKVQLPVAALAITDIGKAVYASDSGAFVLTAAGNSRVGHVHRFVSGGVGIVKFAARAIPVAP
jgi:hypothetical protein